MLQINDSSLILSFIAQAFARLSAFAEPRARGEIIALSRIIGYIELKLLA